MTEKVTKTVKPKVKKTKSYKVHTKFTGQVDGKTFKAHEIGMVLELLDNEAHAFERFISEV